MKAFWENSGNATLFKEWPGGVVEGLVMKGGLYNDKPLLNFLTNEVKDIVPNQRFVNVGLTDALTATYQNY